jgi:hypothetical protein
MKERGKLLIHMVGAKGIEPLASSASTIISGKLTFAKFYIILTSQEVPPIAVTLLIRINQLIFCCKSELDGCHIIQRAMRPHHIVIDSPFFYNLSGMPKRHKPVLV